MKRILDFFKKDHQIKYLTKPRGVALVIVTVSLALISAVTAELTANESVRYKLAINERDALKAEALATSGINFAKLLLVIQGPIQKQMTAAMAQFGMSPASMPSLVLWELIPIDSASLKSLSSGELMDTLGLDIDDSKGSPEENEKSFKENLDFETDFQLPKGGFGAFDGEFTVKITDEESKISLRGWPKSELKPEKRFDRAHLLYALMQPRVYDKLFEGSITDNTKVDRMQLVANIFDWIDSNELATDPNSPKEEWGKVSGGSEQNIYSSGALGKDIRPKNAYFDSLGELRLVEGVSDAFLRTFRKQLSLYGSGKVNILTAPPIVLAALVRACARDSGDAKLLDQKYIDEILQEWDKVKNGGLASNDPKGFAKFISTQVRDVDIKSCEGLMGTESENFTIESTGSVGGVKRKLTLILRVHDTEEESYYFRNN